MIEYNINYNEIYSIYNRKILKMFIKRCGAVPGSDPHTICRIVARENMQRQRHRPRLQALLSLASCHAQLRPLKDVSSPGAIASTSAPNSLLRLLFEYICNKV